MQHSITRHIANILLACYSLVFIHAVIPHSHFENKFESKHDAIEHHHDNEGESHSHSGLLGFLDFLNDLTHSEIGENHLEEYLSSSQKIIPNSDDVDGDYNSNAFTYLVFQINAFDAAKPESSSLQKDFFDHSPRRGPPLQPDSRI